MSRAHRNTARNTDRGGSLRRARNGKSQKGVAVSDEDAQAIDVYSIRRNPGLRTMHQLHDDSMLAGLLPEVTGTVGIVSFLRGCV